MRDELELIIKITSEDALNKLKELQGQVQAVSTVGVKGVAADQIQKDIDAAMNITEDYHQSRIKTAKNANDAILDDFHKLGQKLGQTTEGATKANEKAELERLRRNRTINDLLVKSSQQSNADINKSHLQGLKDLEKINQLRGVSNKGLFNEKAKLIAREISEEEKLRKAMAAIAKEATKLAATVKRVDIAPISKAEALEKQRKILVDIEKVTRNINKIETKGPQDGTNAATVQIKRQREELSRLQKEYKDTSAAVKRFDQINRENEKAIARQVYTIRNLIYSLQNLSREADAVLRPMAEMTKVVVGFTAAFAALATGLGTIAVKDFADVEQGLQKIKVLMGSDELKFTQVRQSLFELSEEVPFAMQKINEAFFLFESTTNLGVEGLELFKVATKGAVGGFADLTDSATTLANIMNIFKVDTKDAEQTMDTLIKTSNRGQFSFKILAGLLTTIAANAKLSNVSLSELGSIIVAASKTFGGAARNMRKIITGLNTGLTSMVKTINNSKSAFKELGIDVLDSTRNIRSLFDILIEIADKKIPIPKVLELFPNQRAAKIVNSILSNIDILKREFDEINNATGETERAYKTMMDTLDAQTKVFSNNVVLLGKDVAVVLAPAIRETIAAMTELIETWRDYDEQNKITESVLNDTIIPLLAKLNVSLKVLSDNLPDIIQGIDFTEFKRSIQDFFGLVDSVDLSTAEGIQAFAQNVIDIFTKMIDFTSGAVDAFAIMIGELNSLASTVADTLPKDFAKFAGALGTASVAMRFFLRNVVDVGLQVVSFAAQIVLLNKVGSLLNVTLFPTVTAKLELFGKAMFGASNSVAAATTRMDKMIITGGKLTNVLAKTTAVLGSLGVGVAIGTGLNQLFDISEKITDVFGENLELGKRATSFAEVEQKRFSELQAKLGEVSITLGEMRTIQGKFGTKVSEDTERWIELLDIVRDKHIDISDKVFSKDFSRLKDVAITISGADEDVGIKEQIKLIQELKKEFEIVDTSVFLDAFDQIADRLDTEKPEDFKDQLSNLYSFLLKPTNVKEMWISKWAGEARLAEIATIDAAISVNETRRRLIAATLSDYEVQFDKIKDLFDRQAKAIEGVAVVPDAFKETERQVNNLDVAIKSYNEAIKVIDNNLKELDKTREGLRAEIVGEIITDETDFEEQTDKLLRLSQTFDDIVKFLNKSFEDISLTGIEKKLQPLEDLRKQLTAFAQDTAGLEDINIAEIGQFQEASEVIGNILTIFEQISEAKKTDIALQEDLNRQINAEFVSLENILKALGEFSASQDNIRKTQSFINELFRENVTNVQESVSKKIEAAISSILGIKQSSLKTDIDILRESKKLTPELQSQIGEWQRLEKLKKSFSDIKAFDVSDTAAYHKALDDLELKYLETIELLGEATTDVEKRKLQATSEIILKAAKTLFDARTKFNLKLAEDDFKLAQQLGKKKISLIEKEVQTELKLRQSIQKIQEDSFKELLRSFGDQSVPDTLGRSIAAQVDVINEKAIEIEGLETSEIQTGDLISEFTRLSELINNTVFAVNKGGWSRELDDLIEITSEKRDEISEILRTRPKGVEKQDISEFIGYTDEDLKQLGVEWSINIGEGLVSADLNKPIDELFSAALDRAKTTFESIFTEVPSAFSSALTDQTEITSAIDGLGTSLSDTVYDSVKNAVEQALKDAETDSLGTSLGEELSAP
jgi:TP901 family phage tail tape measure protein